jgi:hypothetical protein
MVEVESPHPAGTIGYPSSGHPRYYGFFDSLERTRVPRGTHLVRAFGCNVAQNSNGLVGQLRGEWLWFQGDDHAWNPDLLERLLDADKDVVVPLVCRRAAPFMPVIYKEYDPAKGRTVTYSWNEIQALRSMGQTLVPVAAAGSAGMLVRRHVLEALQAADGECFSPSLAEDLAFTARANFLGFQVYADLGAFMGHITEATLLPWEAPDGRLVIGANIHGFRTLAYKTDAPSLVEAA